MPNEASVILFMGKTAIDKKLYYGRCQESILTRVCSRTNINTHWQACLPMR